MIAMPLRHVILLSGAVVSLIAGPTLAQETAGGQTPAQACGDLAADFESVVLERNRSGDQSAAKPTVGPSVDAPINRPVDAIGGILQPSAIGEGIELDAAQTGVLLSQDERRRVDDLIGSARQAAAAGDADACRRKLNEARAAARQAHARTSQGPVGGDADTIDPAIATPPAVDVPDAVGEGVREGIPNRPGSELPLDSATESPFEEALEPPPINPTGPSIGDSAPGGLDPNLATPSLDGGIGGGGLGGGGLGGGGLGR